FRTLLGLIATRRTKLSRRHWDFWAPIESIRSNKPLHPTAFGVGSAAALCSTEGTTSYMESVLSIYIEFVAKILRGLHVTVGMSGISVGFQEEAQQSLDQRVAKLDAARANL